MYRRSLGKSSRVPEKILDDETRKSQNSLLVFYNPIYYSSSRHIMIRLRLNHSGVDHLTGSPWLLIVSPRVHARSPPSPPPAAAIRLALFRCPVIIGSFAGFGTAVEAWILGISHGCKCRLAQPRNSHLPLYFLVVSLLVNLLQMVQYFRSPAHSRSLLYRGHVMHSQCEHHFL